MPLKHGVSLLTLCPLGQPKKAIGHQPQIEPWLTHDSATVTLARVSEIDPESRICFPSSLILSERSSPSRFRMAAPIGAPLTAPGRSEQHLPHKRESRDRKPATGQAKHDQCPAALLTTNRRSGRGGAGCRNFARLQLDGEIFFLTSSFIERSRGKMIVRRAERTSPPCS